MQCLLRLPKTFLFRLGLSVGAYLLPEKNLVKLFLTLRQLVFLKNLTICFCATSWHETNKFFSAWRGWFLPNSRILFSLSLALWRCHHILCIELNFAENSDFLTICCAWWENHYSYRECNRVMTVDDMHTVVSFGGGLHSTLSECFLVACSIIII